jgi:hypothetical protein
MPVTLLRPYGSARPPAQHSMNATCVPLRRFCARIGGLKGSIGELETPPVVPAIAGIQVHRRVPEQRKHLIIGVPNEIRTRVTAVKGRCPGPLDDGDIRRAGKGTRAAQLRQRDRMKMSGQRQLGAPPDERKSPCARFDASRPMAIRSCRARKQHCLRVLATSSSMVQ